MLYYSLHHTSPQVDFKTATIQGQAPDRGLYFPAFLPKFPPGFIEHIEQRTKDEIAFTAIRPFVGNSIPMDILEKIVHETIHFEFPLVKVNESIYSLELFHGPTLAFKDVGARFMSRCLGYFVKGNNKPVTVLVATSGDTGGAVANGFLGVEGVNVVILYPSGKVSSVQELQLTTLGQNISALEVEGNFDDCQQMVKEAFSDQELNKKIFLTSANSINVARWLPQQFYYLFAYQQWQDKAHPPVISVPSGNFGNICAGMVAYLQGMPAKHFIAAVNANDAVAKYMATGQYESQPAIPTISNAMDVGNPSNFVRILELFGNEYPVIKNQMSSVSISDETTKATLKKVHSTNHYLMDPHGAVAYNALENYLSKNPGEKGIFLETAHPVKFYDVVEPILGEQVEIPAAIQGLLTKEKKSIKIKADYKILKEFLVG